MATKLFALLFVLCLTVSSALGQLGTASIRYDSEDLPVVGSNVTGWINTGSTAGSGDLTPTGNTVTVGCGGNNLPGVDFTGSNYLSGLLGTPLTIASTDTVVVLLVVANEGGIADTGRRGVLASSNSGVIPWTEDTVGVGAFANAHQYYEDAIDASPLNTVTGTRFIQSGQPVALGIVYTPDPANTAGDYIVINGPDAIEDYNALGTASVATFNAFASIALGWRPAGADANQFFEGCIAHVSVFVSSTPLEQSEVAQAVLDLATRFGTEGSTPGNTTNVPSPSPVSLTTTTGRRGTTTTGRRTTTTGRRATTGRRGSTTEGVSGAALAAPSPVFQAVFVVFVSFFMFFRRMW